MNSSSIKPLHVDRWINRCWRRLRFGQFLKVSADWLAMYLLCFGTVVLAVKLRWPQLWPQVLWLTLGTIPVTTVAWWLSRRNRFTRDESIAVLDQRLDAGGLLMTLSELPDSQWEAHLPQMEQLWRRRLPQLWPTRFVRQLFIPVLFIAVVVWIPPRQIVASTTRVDVGRQAAQQVEELLEEIREAELLRDEEREQISEAVQRLSEDTAKAPLTHEKWETIDALRNRMTARVNESSAKLGQLKEAVGAMADALDGKSLTGMTAEQREQAEKEFFETLRKLNKNGSNGLPGASKELKDRLQRLLKSGELPQDSEERQELLNDLKEYLDQEFDKLEDLRKKCKKCEGEGEGACKECGDGQCKDGQCQGERGGRGGITRGPGAAPLTWGDESKLEGTKFKESILPEGRPDKLRDEVIGVTATSPDVEPGTNAPRNQARQSTVETGSETWNRAVRPRHRPVLKKYFDQ